MHSLINPALPTDPGVAHEPSQSQVIVISKERPFNLKALQYIGNEQIAVRYKGRSFKSGFTKAFG